MDSIPSPQYWPLHKLLILRIGLTALLLAGLAAATVYWVERQQLHRAAVELAEQRAAEFVAVAGDVLDAPGSETNGAVQARLDRFVRGHSMPRDGGLVAATIFDAGGVAVARVEHPDYAGHAAELNRLASQSVATGRQGEETRPVQIDGARVYFLQVPLETADKRVLGRVAALYAPSAAYLAEFDRRLVRAVLFAFIAVLLTAAILYPVIQRLMRRVIELSASLRDANLEMLSVLGSAIAKRDADTDAHNYRVTLYSVHLAEAVGVDLKTMQALIKGAFLHDVGKIGIPDHILLKPGKLDEVEYAQMKQHVAHGLDIVRRASWLSDAEAVVGGHHEKFDGGGYDSHHKAGEIPIVARIFAIADVFDALTSHRPYKAPLSFDASMEILSRDRGTHFDPQLLDAFAAIARPLHEALTTRGEDYSHQELQTVLTRYFRQDIETLLAREPA
jgi:HD-GYP domain-containing protein (c-di-GMP phosphodiesterase class II)